MELKAIEGVRVAAGDTLVVVLPVNVPQSKIEQLKHYVAQQNIGLIVLPAGSQVFVKERG